MVVINDFVLSDSGLRRFVVCVAVLLGCGTVCKRSA